MTADLEAELARVNALLKARTDALNRTVKRAETAEAKVARVEALHARDQHHPEDCGYCETWWPCATVRAITGEDGP